MKISNKLLVASAVMVAMAGCASQGDRYERQVQAEYKWRSQMAVQAVEQAPKWMYEVPTSTAAVYASGTAVSTDLGMSTDKAKTLAFGKICMSAGGRVNQQSSLYRADTETAGSEFSELAVKSFCPQVDITGAEVVQTKIVPEGGRFRSYVLVALPVGEANKLAQARDNANLQRRVEQRANQVLDSMPTNPQ
jgi:hypothetical protein